MQCWLVDEKELAAYISTCGKVKLPVSPVDCVIMWVNLVIVDLIS